MRRCSGDALTIYRQYIVHNPSRAIAPATDDDPALPPPLTPLSRSNPGVDRRPVRETVIARGIAALSRSNPGVDRRPVARPPSLAVSRR
ncbi:hypothetical protein FHR89_001593 [Cellulomonas uda]|uniref:Uncharacterized protein n=1 Tax=Cellulomonas uda TaxID=1714 RepID=A0A4Y3K9R8_CELUD|nr:hypothetical protein [Cellulomonas uda]GEA79560.1 hypothetical protein CUD01_00040 [Cellulomonas uda]